MCGRYDELYDVLRHKNLLITQWALKSPDDAHNFLSRPDILVTNKSDKDEQVADARLERA